MKKKILIAALAVVLALSLFAGCAPASSAAGEATGTPAASEAVSQVSEGETQNATNEKSIKIGVSIWGTADPLGKTVSGMIDYAADALGVEVEYAATNFDTDAVVSSVENLVASGCKGIIICNSADGQMPKVIKTCQDNGVYLAQFFRTISDEDVKALADQSDYFVGRTCENEYDVGYNLGLIMADKGCKNVGIISYNHGDLTAETRYTGYVAAFKEKGINILAEQWECLTAEEGATAANSFLSSYPELDGIAVVGGGGEPLSGTMNAIENNGKTGKIVVVSTDFTTTLAEDLEAGKVSAMSGGHWTDPFFSFMLVYNAINGAYDPAEFPIEINHPMIYVSSPDDYRNYQKWFEGEIPPFNTEEIKNLAITFNPQTTLDDLKAAAANLSLEDVMTRHEGQIN
jgi:ribose transport system substrate-binding protein